MNPFHADFPSTSIILHFCIWSKITDVSRRMTSNILQHLQITNSTYPLKMAMAETSWKNSLSLLVLSPFYLVQPIYIYIYTNIYIYIYINIYIYIHIIFKGQERLESSMLLQVSCWCDLEAYILLFSLVSDCLLVWLIFKWVYQH